MITLLKIKINGKIGRNIGLIIIIIIANNRSRNRLQRSFNVVLFKKDATRSRGLMEKLEETNNNNNNRRIEIEIAHNVVSTLFEKKERRYNVTKSRGSMAKIVNAQL